MTRDGHAWPCPECGAKTGVTDSRTTTLFGGHAIRRRRRCEGARRHDFTTYEILQGNAKDAGGVVQKAEKLAIALLHVLQGTEPDLEPDASFRARLIEAFPRMNDLDRAAVSTVTGAGLDAIGEHVGIERSGP